MARVTAIGTALPGRALSPAVLKQQVLDFFPDAPREIWQVFDHAGVETRHFASPPGYHRSGLSFARRNEDFVRHALQLSERAAEAALERAELSPRDIDHLFLVTTTGLATPSLDAHLIPRMGFRPDVRRTPIFGIGCAGGAAGLARASEYVRAFPDHAALLLCVELCAQTFNPADRSPANLIAAALFADGAAAAVVEGASRNLRGVRVVATDSRLFEGTLDLMGWRFRDTGFELLMSREIPGFVRSKVRDVVDGFLRRHGLGRRDISTFILHPGGPKVMQALEESLELPEGALAESRKFLRDCGNLSSASVLFVFDLVMRERRPAAGEYGVLLAVGPGFSFETLLLRF